MDANDDVRDGEVMKALMEICIFKAVVSNYGSKNISATYATNKQRKQLDSIWTSPDQTVLRCGFIPFHEIYSFQSNHQLIWADICNKDLLGHSPQHIYRVPTSNVKSNNLDNGEMYIQCCLEKYKYEDVINDFQTLAFSVQKIRDNYDMRDQIIHIYAFLATKIEKIQMEVDKLLGQFFTGAVP